MAVSVDEVLRARYPPIEAYMPGRLQVSTIHNLYFEQSGNPRGQPVVFVHGGPGGGTSDNDRRFFDPSFYRIVIFDQRGAGKSTPMGSLEENTTWDLVSDMEVLRQHLGINKWVVFGGSWGSTLALAYAETNPDRVEALILRGIFTVRKEEIDFFYQSGASYIFPDYWEEYRDAIPPAERGDFVTAYYKRLTGSNRAEQVRCAKAWSKWEGATSKLYVDHELLKKFEKDEFALTFARIEAHYFFHHGFFDYDGQLIAEANKIRHIPTTIVQGRYDMVCPIKTCWDLHRAFPEAELIIIDDNGHSALEPGISAELVKACDRVRDMLKKRAYSAPTSSEVVTTPRRTSLGGPGSRRASGPSTPVISQPLSPTATSPTYNAASAYSPMSPGGTSRGHTSQGRVDPASMPTAGVRMDSLTHPDIRYHQRRDPNLQTQSPEGSNIPNALHKKPLQPPGGRSSNIIFG